jgi:hypothetical protein
MKYILLFTLVTIVVLKPGIASANDRNQALTACRAHIAGIHQDGLRTKVKKIRDRKGYLEVKMKVSANGERFNAVCKVASNGDLAYSTDREIGVSGR